MRSPWVPAFAGRAELSRFELNQLVWVQAMAKLRLRVDLDNGEQIGWGKIQLLEKIEELGSISAAGRSLGMSYRRAWQLIDSINRCFHEPAVTKQSGGERGGGAVLTPFGRKMVSHYRAMERDAAKVAKAHLKFMRSARAKPAKLTG